MRISGFSKKHISGVKKHISGVQKTHFWSRYMGVRVWITRLSDTLNRYRNHNISVLDTVILSFVDVSTQKTQIWTLGKAAVPSRTLPKESLFTAFSTGNMVRPSAFRMPLPVRFHICTPVFPAFRKKHIFGLQPSFGTVRQKTHFWTTGPCQKHVSGSAFPPASP